MAKFKRPRYSNSRKPFQRRYVVIAQVTQNVHLGDRDLTQQEVGSMVRSDLEDINYHGIRWMRLTHCRVEEVPANSKPSVLLYK